MALDELFALVPLWARISIVLIWVAIINLQAYAAMAEDKRRAQRGFRRIPEARLLSLAFWGGALGAMLAQHNLRHKTRKQPFALQLRLIALFHAALLLGLAVVLR